MSQSNEQVKYPRTMHCYWSEGVSDDDKVLHDYSNFEGKEIVVTIKFDGENASLTRNYCYARSLDSKDHESRHWLKGLWNTIRYEIPDGYRICGENLYAQHSIKYDDLESYFYVFNIWNDKNECLSWEDTIEWCSLLNLCPVKVLYEGIYNESYIKNISIDTTKQEGYVVRLAESFHYDDFCKSVFKYVRSNHVQTDQHWMYSEIKKNKLSGKLL